MSAGPLPPLGDLRMPSDNEWDVPALIPSLQASALDLPLVQWGGRARKGEMQGTWGFYVDDYRFTALWTDPRAPLRSQPAACIEPNFSVFDQTPLPVALWHTYRKRWIARYWQLAGVRLWVDINVSETHSRLNLLGVPRGWSAYATRGYDDRLQALGSELALALEHSGGTATLLVYGGGEAVEQWARAQGSRVIHVRHDTAPRLFKRPAAVQAEDTHDG